MKTRVSIFLVLLLVVITSLVIWKQRPAPLPDEKKAALELLVETQSGPRYFEASGDAAKPDEQGLVWLDPASARAQVDHILKARHWSEPERAKIAKLITESSEPHPSRVIGGERINLAKLNLALDSLP